MPPTPTVTAERIQYRVGHGGFHATIVTPSDRSKESLVYVYDIGAQPRKQHAVDSIPDFVTRLQVKKIKHIDYIFISHIDEDHVNAFDDLMRALKNFTVREVVMPWMGVAERLVAKSRNRHRGTGAAVMRLADDPEGYVRELGGGKVTFVTGRNHDQVTNGDGGARDHDGATPPADAQQSGTTLATSPGDAWQLIPFRLEPPQAVLDAMIVEVRNRTGLDANSPADHDKLLSTAKHNHRTYRQHLRLATHAAAKSGKLANRKAGSVTNWSSLVLYSGSGAAGNCAATLNARGDLETLCSHGWLHTGDLPLKVPAVLAEFRREWMTLLTNRSLCVLVAPHHGSKHSHHADLYTIIPACTIVTTNGRNWNGGSAKGIDLYALRSSVGATPILELTNV